MRVFSLLYQNLPSGVYFTRLIIDYPKRALAYPFLAALQVHESLYGKISQWVRQTPVFSYYEFKIPS